MSQRTLIIQFRPWIGKLPDIPGRGAPKGIKLRGNTNVILPKSLVAPSKSPPVGETLASRFFKSSLPGRIIHRIIDL
jgi:hypothetical protein